MDISFKDLGLDESVLNAVAAKGFEEPTPIQVLAIPRLLNGDANVIAKARTGTGKTAAYGLPLVQELREPREKPRALVLVPTRELALQVASEIESFKEVNPSPYHHRIRRRVDCRAITKLKARMRNRCRNPRSRYRSFGARLAEFGQYRIFYFG